jgi:hypothetical protein
MGPLCHDSGLDAALLPGLKDLTSGFIPELIHPKAPDESLGFAGKCAGQTVLFLLGHWEERTRESNGCT